MTDDPRGIEFVRPTLALVVSECGARVGTRLLGGTREVHYGQGSRAAPSLIGVRLAFEAAPLTLGCDSIGETLQLRELGREADLDQFGYIAHERIDGLTIWGEALRTVRLLRSLDRWRSIVGVSLDFKSGSIWAYNWGDDLMCGEISKSPELGRHAAIAEK